MITALTWFGAEKDVVLDGLDKQLRTCLLSSTDTTRLETLGPIRAIGAKGSTLFGTARTGANFILGSPWLCP